MKLTVGAFADARLLAQRFATNPVLAGLANPAFQRWGWFSTNHALLLGLCHWLAFQKNSSLSVEYFNLFGVLEHNLQAVLWVIFDRAANFHLSVLEFFRRQLVLVEKLHGRGKNNRG